MTNVISKIFILGFSIIVLFLFSVYIFSHTRIAGDAASHLLLAVSPVLDIGSPYKDFWEIKPPVWPLVLYLWSSLFGFGILSIKIINIIIAVFVLLVGLLIYKKVFQTPVLEILFVYTIVVLLSPILNSIMVPTELLGLLFSLCALLVVISFQKDFSKFYFSGLLFLAASQTKEPFTFTVLAMLPIFIYAIFQKGTRVLIKNIIQFLLGVLTGLGSIYIYLTTFDSVNAYKEIFQYKQVAFPLSMEKLSQNFLPGFYASARTFTEFSSGLTILLFFALISFYIINKFKKILTLNLRNSRLNVKPIVIFDSAKVIKYTILLYAIGSFLGFGLGGSFGSHYLIQVVVPFYMVTGLLISYLFSNTSFLLKKSKFYFFLILILFVLSAIIVMPKRPYLSSYLGREINFETTDQVFGYDKRLTEITTENQCVLIVYGWGVSENYLYSKRKPCTRFFLPNIVSQNWQKKEYARNILDNPPAAIIYQTTASDMDIQKFELEVINVSKIIKNCYTQDTVEDLVYIPKIKDTDSLKNCIKTNSI